MPKFRSCTLLSLLLTLGITTQAAAEQAYEVRRGDSLSSIAAQQLGNSERWREIWALNPRIRRPEQLAVGMRLRLPEVGKPIAAATPSKPASHTPQAETPDAVTLMAEELINGGLVDRVRRAYRLLDSSQPSIRLHAVRHEQDGLYLYSNSLGQRPLKQPEYGIFQTSVEPATQSTLELTRIGLAEPVMRQGNMAGFRVTASRQTPTEQSLLLPLTLEPARLKPHYPSQDVSARIIKALYEQPDGYLLILDKGSRQGLEPGQLLGLEQRNPVESTTGQALDFPGHRAGWAIVVDTSRETSLALVMSASRVPAIGDRLH